MDRCMDDGSRNIQGMGTTVWALVNRSPQKVAISSLLDWTRSKVRKNPGVSAVRILLRLRREDDRARQVLVGDGRGTPIWQEMMLSIYNFK